MISKGNAKKKKKKKTPNQQKHTQRPRKFGAWQQEKLTQSVCFANYFPLAISPRPSLQSPLLSVQFGFWRSQEPSQGSTPHFLPHQDDAAVCNHMGQSHGAQKSTLFIKKHVFTTLSKLSERMYLPTVHC